MQFQALLTFSQIYRQLETPLKRRYWRVLTLSGVISLLELAITAALSLLGVALAAPESLLGSPITQRLVALFPALTPATQDQRILLTWLMIALCLAIAFKALALAWLTWRQACFSQTVGVFFSVKLYRLLLSAPYLWHVRQDLSFLLTRLMWARFSADYLLAFMQSQAQFLVAGTLVVVVALVSPWAAALVCATATVSSFVAYHLAQRKVRSLNATSMRTEQAATQVSYPSLAGIREVKIYAQEGAFLHQFTAQRQGFSRAQSVLPVVYPAPSWLLDFAGMVMLLLALLVMGGQGWSVARLTGELALLAAVTWRLLPAVDKLVTYLLQVQQHQVYTLDGVRFIENLQRELAAAHVPEAALGTCAVELNAPTPEPPRECVAPCPLRTALELRDVSFRYPDTPATRPDALHGLNVRIAKGSMVGFIGSSGAGKSTVVGLLTGLLSPTGGAVLVDGQPLHGGADGHGGEAAAQRGKSWLRSIGYVPQSPFLLNASIAANVAFSQWGRAIDRERVEQCCRMAAMDFVAELPEGLETIIGERGVRLSGGQVQRVAIARALYGRPQLILFDEATSALDGAAEQAIQHTIESLGGQATLVLVAHRLSTVRNCDYLYWLGDGGIVMEGAPSVVLPQYEAWLDKRAGTLY